MLIDFPIHCSPVWSEQCPSTHRTEGKRSRDSPGYGHCLKPRKHLVFKGLEPQNPTIFELQNLRCSCFAFQDKTPNIGFCPELCTGISRPQICSTDFKVSRQGSPGWRIAQHISRGESHPMGFFMASDFSWYRI